jgi:hypothetical protein
MFRLFSAAEPQTRFNTCLALKPIFSSIKALRSKEHRLGAELDNQPVTANNEGATAPVNQRPSMIRFRESEEELKQRLTSEKHDILSNLLIEIDEAIAKFNHSSSTSPEEEKEEVLHLVTSIKAAIRGALSDHDGHLEQHRDENRALVDNAVHYGTVGGAVVAAIALPMTFVAGVGAFYGAEVVSTAVRYVTGISDLTPESAKILYKLNDRLDLVEDKLIADAYIPTVRRR